MTTSAPERTGTRIDSVDLIRGIVMVLMAIDHVRVYAGVPAGGPDPAVFFTRWITHFVAPAFAFFAGTGAYFHGQKLGDKRALTKFLVSRGLILVALELTIIRVFWTFNFDFKNYMIAGVIWMLGWCMVMMGGLVRLSTRTVGITGLVIVMGQQIFRLIDNYLPGALASVLYEGGGLGPLGILYVLVPWIGVMALGYAFGALYSLDDATRRRRTFNYAIAATLFFLVLGTVQAVMVGGGGEGGEGSGGRPFWFRLLNQQKYPASQLFLGMTLGPTLLLLPYAERWRGKLAGWLTTLGRVPMFYYLLHIPTIHIAACIVSIIRVGKVDPWLFGNFPMAPSEQPPGYRWSLALLYFVWAVCVVALYFPSAWYAKLRASKRYPWLSYI